MRMLLLILGVVFSVESVIMGVIAAIAPSPRDSFLLSILDAVVLVAVLSPALWLLVVRPLRSLVAERGALLARTLTIQEEERARLAHDLHDELGQTQTAILLGLRSITNAKTLEQARERADGVHEMAVGAIEATRRMARGLSPSVLADFGLAKAVERVCEDFAASGEVEIIREIRMGAVRLATPVEIAAFRVLQEAMTNAVKHSAAGSIRIQLVLTDNKLMVRVADDGRGIEGHLPAEHSPGGGLGLAGMRERVVLLGGEFVMTSSPAAGTTVRATFPALPLQS